MSYPAFFDDAPSITVRDGLASFLGVNDDGIFTYRYIDAVRLAGHSCPTVAGAYLMARKALGMLYPHEIPERGQVKVRFSASLDAGAAGVIGSVVSLITGAAGRGGFKGIGRNYRRQDLMYFGCAVEGGVQFERLDTGASVNLGMATGIVEESPEIPMLLQKILNSTASMQEQKHFGTLWQQRVKAILLDYADDPALLPALEITD